MRPANSRFGSASAASAKWSFWIAAPSHFRRDAKLVGRIDAVPPTEQRSVIVAVLTIASVAHPAARTQRYIALTPDVAAPSEPSPIRVVPNQIVVEVVAKAIIQGGIQRPAFRKQIVQPETAAQMVERIPPQIRIDRGARVKCVVFPVIPKTSFHERETNREPALLQ